MILSDPSSTVLGSWSVFLALTRASFSSEAEEATPSLTDQREPGPLTATSVGSRQHSSYTSMRSEEACGETQVRFIVEGISRPAEVMHDRNARRDVAWISTAEWCHDIDPRSKVCLKYETVSWVGDYMQMYARVTAGQ